MKKFDGKKFRKCPASPPYPPGSEYIVFYGDETTNIDKNTKIAEKAKVIKVVISQNGSIIPNKSPVFPVCSDDIFRVTSEMNKLASDIINDSIIPVKLLIQRNKDSKISLEEVRFKGSLVYDKTFNVKTIYDEDGNFVRYDSTNKFLEKIKQTPCPGDIIFYRYKIYKTPKNKLLCYKEHCHMNENEIPYYFDSNYHVCEGIPEVIEFTHNLPQQDVFYLFFVRNEIEITELPDI